MGADLYDVTFLSTGVCEVLVSDSGSTGDDGLTVNTPDGSTPTVDGNRIELDDEVVIADGVELIDVN